MNRIYGPCPIWGGRSEGRAGSDVLSSEPDRSIDPLIQRVNGPSTHTHVCAAMRSKESKYKQQTGRLTDDHIHTAKT